MVASKERSNTWVWPSNLLLKEALKLVHEFSRGLATGIKYWNTMSGFPWKLLLLLFPYDSGFNLPIRCLPHQLPAGLWTPTTSTVTISWYIYHKIYRWTTELNQLSIHVSSLPQHFHRIPYMFYTIPRSLCFFLTPKPIPQRRAPVLKAPVAMVQSDRRLGANGGPPPARWDPHHELIKQHWVTKKLP